LGSLAIALRMLRDQVERFSFSWQYSHKMFSFMVFSGATGASQQLFRYMDRITVGAVLGLSSVAYYTVLTGIVNRLVALSGTLTEALMPAASSWCATGNRDRLRKYLWRSTAIIALMNLTLGVFLIVFSEMLLRLWMGTEFAGQTLASFRILVLIYSLSAMTAPAYHIANGIGVPWANTLGGALGSVGTIVLIVVLGRLFDLEGASWANAASWARFIALAYVIYKLRRSDQSF
jgi:O-antigen/teichoic acid export membrane protein